MAKGKSNKGDIQETKKIKCPSCSRELVLNSSNFYKSNKPEYEKTEGYCYLCKHCIRSLCFNGDNTINIDGLKQALETLDKPFIKVEYMKILSKGSFDIGTYLKNVSFNSYKGWTYADSDNEDKECNSNNAQNTSKVENKTFDEFEITEEDIQAQKDVIRLLGYDPFLGYTDEDKKYLYSNLLVYLDEDTLQDGIKLSAYIQIVNNNNQIRKIDLTLSNLNSNIKSMIENAKAIDTLQSAKSKIVSSNDKIMKENSISVKNRGDKKAGRSTLTYMMRDLRELEFEDAEEDYYDQKKAHGMKLVADISNKSMLEQLSLDENDYVDIIKQQRERLQISQQKIDDLIEENRQLYIEIDKLKEMLNKKIIEE